MALIHPIAKFFGNRVIDFEVRNIIGPHSIDDYLADKRIAGAIGQV